MARCSMPRYHKRRWTIGIPNGSDKISITNLRGMVLRCPLCVWGCVCMSVCVSWCVFACVCGCMRGCVSAYCFIILVPYNYCCIFFLHQHAHDLSVFPIPTRETMHGTDHLQKGCQASWSLKLSAFFVWCLCRDRTLIRANSILSNARLFAKDFGQS